MQLDMHSFHALLHATPTFSGAPGEDAIRWLLRIDRISVPLHCGDEAKLAVALAKLEGSAYNYSESSVYATWGDFKTALTLRYAEDKHIIRQKLTKCKQAAGEDVSDYVDRHRMLCIRAGLSDRDSEEVLNKFLKGLIPTLYDRVMVSCPTTYDQAVEKAVYFSKQLGKTGRGHLLQNDGENTGSKSAARAPFNYPNRSSELRYEPQGHQHGLNTDYHMPPIRTEVAGITDHAQDLGSRLKLNMRSTLNDRSYQHNYVAHPPLHNLMTRSTYDPHSVHSETNISEVHSDDGSESYQAPTPVPVVGMRMVMKRPPIQLENARMGISSIPLMQSPCVRKSSYWYLPA